MNNNIQQAMMAMELLKQLRQPQMEERDFMLREQALNQQGRTDRRRLGMDQQQLDMGQQRQDQMQKLGILEALTGVSRDPLTGGADPSLVLEYLRSIGVNVPRPAQAAGPASFFQQTQQTK